MLPGGGLRGFLSTVLLIVLMDPLPSPSYVSWKKFPYGSSVMMLAVKLLSQTKWQSQPCRGKEPVFISARFAPVPHQPGWTPSLRSCPDTGFLGPLKEKTLIQEAARGSSGDQNQSAHKNAHGSPDRPQLLSQLMWSHRSTSHRGREQSWFCPHGQRSEEVVPPAPWLP